MARTPRPVQPPIADPVPEPDRLAGYPHPRATALILGQDRAKAELKAAFDGGRIHHGWLLTGRSGIGKATVAYAFARYCLAESSERITRAGDIGPDPLAVDPDSSAARQVRVLSHPGLLLLRRAYDHKTKKHMSVISVDEVRRLRSFLSHSAGGGERRIVIVDSLDEINTNAANALLKGLEEPPAGVIFLLIASELGRVLPHPRSGAAHAG
jgi:DNA polymerase III subunit delta'